jgi:late competence protein required for DNA uptake (superfamily II DNA/RNA helicase)
LIIFFTQILTFDGKLPEVDIITVRKRAVCPRCGMTVAEGGKMYRSLKMPNKYVCRVCAILEREELKRERRTAQWRRNTGATKRRAM